MAKVKNYSCVRAVFGIYYILFVPVCAGLALIGIFSVLQLLDMFKAFSVIAWIVAAPFLYLTWLILVLVCGFLEVQFFHLIGYRKPARALSTDRGMAFFRVAVSLGSYIRVFQLWSLPCVRSLQVVPVLRHLVLLAYSRRSSLGHESLLFGYLYDPDLTEIGDGAVIGGGCSITCHSATTTPDGAIVYTSAPVSIGARAVLGNETTVSQGVRIGPDALVEPSSNVLPFTVIGPAEVWAGNPAVFVRKRFPCTDQPAEASPQRRVLDKPAATPVAEGDAIHRAVAAALNLPLAEVHDDLTADQCFAWDSLGQISLAATLHDRFGLNLPAAEIFQVRSVRDIRRLLAQRQIGHQPGCPVTLPDNPELLPLLDHEAATFALARRDQRTGTDSKQELTVVIAATFTSEPLASALKLWSQAFGIRVHVEFISYDQVHQALLAPDSPFHRNCTGLNLVLTRPEDLLAADGSVDTVLDAIAAFAQNRVGTLVVGTLPPVVSSLVTIERGRIDELRANWRRRLLQEAVELLDFGAIVEQLGISSAASGDLEIAAQAPYSPRVYQELGIALARLVRRCRVPSAKVIAVDADGVLWGGVLAEDGIDGILLGPDQPGRSYQLFQQQLLQLRQRGFLLVIVSRNAESDVWNVIDHHPGMVLRRQDIAAVRINWQPKSANLRQLAEELNLGLDAFIFLDDDPAMRLEVAAHVPQVTVVPLPNDSSQYTTIVRQLWCLDSTTTTAEDQSRTLFIQQETGRQQHHKKIENLAEYLHSLELRGQIRLAEERDLPRVAQLTQKTNQFNLSLRRRTLAEIKALGPDYQIYVIEAADRFGTYGLVGACILQITMPDVFELDTLVMSCRALGRGLEEAVLHDLLQTVSARHGSRLIAPYVSGSRNQPVKDFLERYGFQSKDGYLTADVSVQRPLPTHIAWQGLAAA